MINSSKLSLLFLLIFITLFSQTIFSQSLQIYKVEPPNWWTGMKWNTVQLMLYGEDLQGITAEFEEKDIRIKAIHTLPNPSYAFIDIHIPDDLAPGNYALNIQKGNQLSTVDFPILQRNSSPPNHQGFDENDVIYLLTPDRFANGKPGNDRFENGLDDFDRSKAGMRHGGDLQGVIQHLPYLKDLGITAIWLNPVLENAGRNSYHGYAATDLYKIDPRFGTNEEYRQLVQEAHEHGIKVIFDHVNNHIGIQHPWMKNLPMDDWVNGSVDEHELGKHYLKSIIDPHAAPNSEEQLKIFWFVDAMPDLNQRNLYLGNYLIQNTLWWMEYTGLDGIREDTYPYPDQNFLSDWAKAILDEYPHSNIVGEIWANEAPYIAQFQKESKLPRDFETNLPCVMDFPLSVALRNYLEGKEKLREVYEVIAQDYLYTDLNNLMVFVDNHDMTRGTYIARGNTAKLKQVLTIILTTRGIPQLLYGSEINMMGGESHVELRADFPGGFPGDKRNAFTDAGRTIEEKDIFNFLQKILHLRKEHEALRSGKLIHYPLTWNNDIYKYLKISANEMFLIIINGHDTKREADISEIKNELKGVASFYDVLNDKTIPYKGQKTIPIKSQGVLIYRIAL